MQRAGFVLVGGQSTRMGQDKARLANGPDLLVETVAKSVNEIASSVALIGAADRYTDLPFERLNDLRPGFGPLSGIETALASRRGTLNLIAACDMPELHRLPLERLFAEAEHTGARCVVVRDMLGNVHPLCAVWRSDCLAAVQLALDEKRLRVSELVQQLKPAVIEVPVPVPNVNTPLEWDTWRNRVAGH